MTNPFFTDLGGRRPSSMAFAGLLFPGICSLARSGFMKAGAAAILFVGTFMAVASLRDYGIRVAIEAVMPTQAFFFRSEKDLSEIDIEGAAVSVDDCFARRIRTFGETRLAA